MISDYPGKCPKCGWFCSDIRATLGENGECLGKVFGTCQQHGKLDLSDQSWEWEDFLEGEG